MHRVTGYAEPLHSTAVETRPPRRSPLRRLLKRLGGLLRHQINNPLQAILSEAELLAERGAADERDVQGAAQSIAAAARRIAAVVADFERIAASEAGAELAETEDAGDPGPLTRALATELNLIARQAEVAVQPQDAQRLRPRLRRAARLARAWLAAGARLRPTYAPAPAPPAPEPTPAAPSPHQAGYAAARALAVRLQRLEADYRRLQEQLERRERFWRFSTHELRNAANAFVSWAYVLRRSEIRNAPWFAPLARAAEAVLRRTEEVLDLGASGMTDFEIRVENVNLVEAARDALEMIRPAADQNNLTLALASPPGGEPVWAEADPDRVQQILHNLLRNAVEATPPGGSICISARYDGACAALEIEDTGTGLHPGAAAGLFQLDSPAEPPAGRRRGYGLGLPLSRYLAEQMRGSLELQPATTGGARLLLRLPRANP
nr:MAG: hypothetical protein DIU52_12770 [bacterium]